MAHGELPRQTNDYCHAVNKMFHVQRITLTKNAINIIHGHTVQR